MTEVNDRPRPIAEVSVVTTVRNEGGTIGALLDSLLGGTRVPAEIVVADGGSTDPTREIVAGYSPSSTQIRLLTDVGDRSSGRNKAISSAGNDRIVTIDGGCVARADWLEHMVEAFESGAAWVGGFYEPAGQGARSTAIGLSMVYVIEEAGEDFMPSARSMGFTRDLWEQAGGFPSGVQFAEDTAFDEALIRLGHHPRFTPRAIVEWIPPRTYAEQWRTMYRWGYGDGLQGLRGWHYRRLLAFFVAFVVMTTLAIVLEPWLLVPAMLPVTVLLVRQTRHKYRHMTTSAKWALIPLATLNGTVSSFIGFLLGRRRRRSQERTAR